MVRPLQAESRPVASTSLDATREARLLQKAIGGDGAAFATLVEPHLDLLYRIAGRAAGSTALAEDAVQEALEIVHRRLDRYEPGTSFKAFVASIAVRRARTLLRSELRRSRRESATPDGPRPATPADLFAAEETSLRIRAALATLPEKRQRIVLLRLDAGLGYAEIATLVGTTEGSARVLVHHALRDLAEKLEDLVDAPRASDEKKKSDP
ncbi:MAG TPA: RNA polymerase sigma factor [Polyangiaceae bacterium]|jgi:RNA polymerase sigma-70 factor (ECF subfamily)|nr:RNA polymerase sigma factor [Polyangiaceae bacterium]